MPTGNGGNLARTGSSDALPTIGLIGGAAVLAGGATVLITRRRRTN
ncbi:LPXTG cell wall anchor domain-containing protein [Streptomyces sp. NPDC003077]